MLPFDSTKDNFTKQESKEEGLASVHKTKRKKRGGTNKTFSFPVKIKQVPYQRNQETSF